MPYKFTYTTIEQCHSRSNDCDEVDMKDLYEEDAWIHWDFHPTEYAYSP